MKDSTTDGRADAFGRFFLPGPTEVRPAVLRAQTRPMIGHRGRAMAALMETLQSGLQRVFRTERPVLVSTSSATGFMEAGVRNAARSRVLALVNGAFSDRFAELAEACGFAVDRFEVPWGEAHEPEAVAARLDEAAYDTVTVVHSETSTGVLNPLREIAEVVARRDDTVLLVDSVTGLGGAPVETDAWGLDFVLTGSQKALALPPGLAFAVASERILERSAAARAKGLYFDLGEFHARMEKLQTPNTPALSLLFALEEQLDAIGAEGMESRWERHRVMAERCRAWVEERARRRPGFRVLAPDGRRSPTVTCIVLPEGVAGPDVVEGVRARGFVIGGGYGKLKPGAIRIGHMGDHSVEELDDLLAVLDEVLEEGAP